MNTLKDSKKESVIAVLVEGNSIRSTERMTGVNRETIQRLLHRVGTGCAIITDETMRNLPCKSAELDEIWCYVGKKQRHVTSSDVPSQVGDFWIYVALDPDTKLIPAYLVGKRTTANTRAFVTDLAGRLANRIQISTDGLEQYVTATEEAFGVAVDYAQIAKSYEAEPIGNGRYGPPEVVSTSRKVIKGNPDYSKISTSHVERQNLSMRMQMRRFTRLNNGFRKTVDRLKAAVHLHFAHYNFCRRHSSLRVTPAMEAGIVNEMWSISELLRVAERAL